MAQVIDTEELVGKLEQKIEGKLDELVGAKVKAALSRIEEIGVKSGFVTPDGGAADKSIKGWGDWLVAVKRNDQKRLKDVYGAAKALNEQDGTEGGYTVPDQFNARLLEVAGEINPIDVLSGARAPMSLPMSGPTMTIPALEQTHTPLAGTSAMTAGVVARWTAEAAQTPATEPKFGKVQLSAHKLAGHTQASNELEADSAVALETLLYRLFGQAIGYARLHAFLRGDGVGKPLGIYNAPAAKSVNRGTGAAVYETEDLLAMASNLLPGSRSRATWFIHPYAEQHLAQLSFGNSQVLVYPSQEGYPMRIMGNPVYAVEFMSAPGTAFDIALVDWSYYLIGNRSSTEIAASSHAAFLTDEMTWRFTHRCDGQPWLKDKITLSDGAGTNTVSPFVYLS